MSLYQDNILNHYRAPRNFGVLTHAEKSVSLYNPLCGDKINMQIILRDNKVGKIKFSGEGCAISLASASLLTEYAKGKTKKELINLDKNFIIDQILGINLSPNRLRCALLPLEALQKLIVS